MAKKSVGIAIEKNRYYINCHGEVHIIMWYSVSSMDWLVMLLKKPRSTDGGDGAY